jgi:proteasome lid subunit RPN8/RPN11
MLILPQAVYDQIRRHGESAYPDECCGILLGSASENATTVMHAIPVHNASPKPRNHYEIALVDVIRAMQQSRNAGEEIVGFYHSHPDHPAQWSATDLAEAHWIGCSYVITSVIDGRAESTNAFHLKGSTEDDKHFEQEEIRVASDVAGIS